MSELVLKLLKYGNSAVKKAQKNNRKNGLPNNKRRTAGRCREG